MQEQDLVFLDLEDPVARDCRAMVNRSQKIVPDNMREDAVMLLSGDCIGRQEERARLQRLLEGDGSASDVPSKSPSSMPSSDPSSQPSDVPSDVPSKAPTRKSI